MLFERLRWTDVGKGSYKLTEADIIVFSCPKVGWVEVKLTKANWDWKMIAQGWNRLADDGIGWWKLIKIYWSW